MDDKKQGVLSTLEFLHNKLLQEQHKIVALQLQLKKIKKEEKERLLSISGLKKRIDYELGKLGN